MVKSTKKPQRDALDDRPFLTIKQAAEVLQVSRDTVEDLCRNGRLDHVRFGRIYRIPRAALANIRAG